MLSRLLDRVLPQCCLLCGSAASAQLCKGCRADLPWQGHSCTQCAIPLADTQASLCGACLKHPPCFSASVAPFLYAPPIDKLIAQFKHHRQLTSGKLLADLLGDHIEKHLAGKRTVEGQQIGQATEMQAMQPSIHPSTQPLLQVPHEIDLPNNTLLRPDFLAPLPLHYWRQWQRSFNQATFLAVQLSGRLQIPLLPLKKIRATPEQKDLSRKARLQNLRGVFYVEPAKVIDKTIAIIDDVMTTGASAEALSQVLLEAGAKRVEVWCVARTPLPGGFASRTKLEL